MKLATLKNGSRDGTLAVVSRDLSKMAPASAVARTLQIALEKWTDAAPRLEQLFEAVNAGTADGIRDYDPEALESPLPRTYQFIDGSAYLNHVELFRKARGAQMTQKLREVPLMYQAVSDGFLRPTGAIPVADPELGIDMEAEVGVIVDDVPMGVSVETAAQYIKLFVLINDISLRALIPEELNTGLGYFHGKPRSSLSPVAVTPDELGAAWGWQQGTFGDAGEAQSGADRYAQLRRRYGFRFPPVDLPCRQDAALVRRYADRRGRDLE
ncbi:MAG: fumarylacetoacetate (FAA) hydrolase [Alphaproteobacteria bacterium]